MSSATARDKRPNKIIQESLADIHIGKRMRDLDEKVVADLMASMQLSGLLYPIITRVGSAEIDGQMETGVTILVAGLHRLEAAKRLGWTGIECREAKGDEIDAALMEITENLHRADLSVIERAEQVAAWARLIKAKEERDEKLRHGAAVSEKKKGGRGKKGGTRQAARDLDLDERGIRRAEKIAGISPAAKEAAKAAGIDRNQTKLLEVAAAPAEKQVEAVVDCKARASKTKAERETAKKAKQAKREAIMAEVQRLATTLVKLDGQLARDLADLLWTNDRVIYVLIDAIRQALGDDDGLDQDGDGLDIPPCLRRAPRA
jgi:ParB-like chromosome segregation protein Spo0J